MKQKLNTLSFIITAFIISMAVIVSGALIVSFEYKKGEFEIDPDTPSVTIFGNRYVLDERVQGIIKPLSDFNGAFLGKGVYEGIKKVFIWIGYILFDVVKIIFGAMCSLINASAVGV